MPTGPLLPRPQAHEPPGRSSRSSRTRRDVAQAHGGKLTMQGNSRSSIASNPYACCHQGNPAYDGAIPCGSCDNCVYGKTQMWDEAYERGRHDERNATLIYIAKHRDDWDNEHDRGYRNAVDLIQT